LFFQLCRKKTYSYSQLSSSKDTNPKVTLDHLSGVENQLNDLLFSLKGYLFISEYQEEKNKYLHLLSFLFKLIAYTRDIYDGKGERDLTYSMIIVWYKYFPKLAMYIFEKVCSSSSTSTSTGFGSWKDAKYLCHHIKKNNILSEEKKEKCIEQIIQIMNTQLHSDFIDQNNLSLIAKWIPREKSKFGWLYPSLVQHWNENFEKPTQPISSYPSFRSTQNPKHGYKQNYSTYQKYRKIISSLNKKIDTTQIKQCERKSNEINYYRVSLHTKHKNQHYFLRNPPQIQPKHPPKKTTPTLNYHLEDTYHNHYSEKIRENILFAKSNTQSIDMCLLPILDMTSDNIEDGIAISILLSEISILSNRIMTYDRKKTVWISLENQSTFFEKKRQIYNHTITSEYTSSKNSTNVPVTKQTNPYQEHSPKKKNHSILAIDCIIKSILETKLPLDKIEDMYFVFISDFASSIQKNGMESPKEEDPYSLIQCMFRENGIIKIPKIVYWNISTEIVPILPCSGTTPNVIFLAGTATSNFHHLFHFSKREEETSVSPINPFSYYNRILNQEKYKPFERYIYQQML